MNLSLRMELAELHPCDHALRLLLGLTACASTNFCSVSSDNEAAVSMPY